MKTSEKLLSFKYSIILSILSEALFTIIISLAEKDSDKI